MSDITITLDGLQQNTLLGYLGELLDNPDTLERDLPVLYSIYSQLTEESN
jgi:hypothetical protein